MVYFILYWAAVAKIAPYNTLCYFYFYHCCWLWWQWWYWQQAFTFNTKSVTDVNSESVYFFIKFQSFEFIRSRTRWQRILVIRTWYSLVQIYNTSLYMYKTTQCSRLIWCYFTEHVCIFDCEWYKEIMKTTIIRMWYVRPPIWNGITLFSG